jgi:peptidyl-prolyl cis-trans isomerase SurA
MFKLIAAAALALGLTGASQVAAQGLFSPVIEVNGDVITRFELEQRARMLEVLRAPGNPETEARRQLVEDRLKLQAAERAGTVPGEEELLEGMAEFAGRANLSTEEFIAALEDSGVAEETFRAFVTSGIAWRTLIQQRFGPRARVSPEEIDRALSTGDRNAGVRVLISEIIIPLTPQTASEVNARAREIAGMTSEAAFADAARRFSATATARSGGRLPWQTLSELPPVLGPLILELAPGEVTDPLPLPDAVALFQLRAIEELPYEPPSYAAIEYAAYYLPGGRTETTLAAAREITARIDRCDDLYGVAKGQPAERLERRTLPPAELPDDIALELSKLDPGETSTALTRSGGQNLMLLMLCGRTVALDLPEAAPEAPAPAEETAEAPATDGAEAETAAPDPVAQARREVANSLRNRRIQSLAESFLSQLQADARIVER